MNLIGRILRECPYAPWFTALILAAVVGTLVMQRACYQPSSPLGLVRTAEPLEYYDPDFLYEIPMNQKWVQTGEVAGVPTMEPADERTKKLVEAALGEEAENVEFLFVGEVGKLKDGADIFFVQDKVDTSVDLDGLPHAVSTPQGGPGAEFPIGPPARLIIRPKKTPLFDWRVLHRGEAAWEWRPDAPDVLEWEIDYRPYEFWIKGRVYVFVEAGYHQRAGDSGMFARGGAGICPGKDCR